MVNDVIWYNKSNQRPDALVRFDSKTENSRREEGSIGKASRLASVFAAKEMVVTLGGKVIPMKENDTLEVFAGADPPNQRIIRSRTFVENIGALSAYLGRTVSPLR